MTARVYLHPAGTDWRSGNPIDAESVTLTASAGVDAPSLTFNAPLSQRPRPRLQHATLVIDGSPVETVFTPVQRGATMIGDDDFGTTSNTCMGAIGHLAELADANGWPHSSMADFAAAARAYIASRSMFQAATGITPASMNGLAIADTLGGSGVSPNSASVDPFGDEITTLLGAIGRYAVANGMPLDWHMDTDRRLRCATPLRRAPNAMRDFIAGHNCDQIDEGIDLGIGRVASNVIVGTKGNSATFTVPGIAGRYGDIDHVAASGSASAIATALSSQLRTFNISIGSGRASVSGGVPSLWIGDRCRVRNSDGEWSRCAIIAASLSVDDGGKSVSINATAAEGDW